MVDTKGNGSFKIGLVIPVFNVEKTIGSVLERISFASFQDVTEIIIIDNHSTDQTISIVKDFLAMNATFKSKVTLLLNEDNYGYGCSIKAGFDYFCGRDVSHVMIIHGDYQVDPAWLIGKLLVELYQKPAIDFVLASRFKSESNIDSYSLVRKLGNYFFNTTTRLCCGHRMSDSGTAMIILKKSILEKVPFRTLSNSWQFHPQLNILIYERPGIQISEIPMNWSDSDAKSTVPLIRYGLILLRMLVSYWYQKNIMRKAPEDIFQSQPIPEGRKFRIEQGGV